MFSLVMLWILVLLGGYLLGALPFGFIVAKFFCGVDPMESGSGNVGATNVARLCGAGWGLAVLLLDVLKGFVPVLITASVTDSWVMVSLMALACICGHIFSVFLKFHGGKGVATAIGVFMALAFWPLLCAAALCVIAIVLSSFISVGSLLLFASLPIFLLICWKAQFLPLALIVMLLIYWRHKDNIKRLIQGEEKAWRSSSNRETSEKKS